jgi:ComF family protein
VLSAVWLGAEAREMIHHLKYEGYTTLAEPIAHAIRRAAPHAPTGVLVPVPLGTRRLRARGYNQAAAIARALSARWQLPVWEHVLGRARDTRSQTSLSPEERHSNVADAFAASSPPPTFGKRETGCGKLGGSSVILVDDVLTTGATLAAAASALEGAGWPTVRAVTFARALPFARRAIEGDGSVGALVAVGAT